MTEEKKQPEKKEEAPARQIIIETDGNNIKVIKAEVAGNFEFKGILQALLDNFNK